MVEPDLRKRMKAALAVGHGDAPCYLEDGYPVHAGTRNPGLSREKAPVASGRADQPVPSMFPPVAEGSPRRRQRSKDRTASQMAGFARSEAGGTGSPERVAAFAPSAHSGFSRVWPSWQGRRNSIDDPRRGRDECRT